jgi:CubicO group peptidase (beta-lactamase class C family)
MRKILIAAAACLATACAGGPVLQQAYAPSSAACAAAEAYSEARQGVTLLVMIDGRVVCEAYSSGENADTGFRLASGTKSFSAAIAAAAVQDGLLSLDEKVADTLPEWRADPGKATVTIRQLLSLTSGLPGGETGAPPPYAEAVAGPLTTAPGQRFQYGPAPFQVFGEVMRRKLQARGSDADALAYLQRRVLDPLGVKPTRWAREAAGNPNLPGGAAFTARDWARFGEFVRLGGAWNGAQLVDRAALRETFRGTRANPAYGIAWWLANPAPNAETIPQLVRATDIAANADALPDDLVMAAGAGQQRLFVIPSLKMTIVRQADFLPRAARRAARAAERAEGVDPDDSRAAGWSDTAFLKLLLPRAAPPG